MSLPLDRQQNLGRADRLKAALAVIERDAPPGFGPDLVDIGRRVNLMVRSLDTHDTVVSCGRCGRPFTFSARRYAASGLTPPQNCYHCREHQRAAHRRAEAAHDDR